MTGIELQPLIGKAGAQLAGVAQGLGSDALTAVTPLRGIRRSWTAQPSAFLALGRLRSGSNHHLDKLINFGASVSPQNPRHRGVETDHAPSATKDQFHSIELLRTHVRGAH